MVELKTRHPPKPTSLIVRLNNLYRRLLAVVLGLVGPRVAYAVMAVPARWLYRLLDPVRRISEGQCRAALGDRLDDAEIVRVAEEAFVHRTWNLTDLMLADRRVNGRNYERFGGAIPEPYKGLIVGAQAKRRPVLLLTAYYGPFDLLPLFLGYNGVEAAAVYKPSPNRGFDAYRLGIRSRSGCSMVPVDEAANVFPQVLEEGGTVAILADHPAGKRGVECTFLNAKMNVPRSVGLFAARYEAIVAVCGIRRLERPFRFEIGVSDYFEPGEWSGQDDSVGYITRRYLAALEKIVLADPAQYLWAHPRWGESPARRETDGTSE